MLIAEKEFNNQKLLEIYKAAYMDADMTDDGEVRLNVEGTIIFANVDVDRSLFVISAMWRLDPSTPRIKLLELCNRVNDQLIMIRCCIPGAFDAPALFVDFNIDTKGGISGEEIIDATRRFKTLCNGIGKVDDDGIL